MEHLPVTSSSIASVAHEGDVLEVKFTSGAHYRYFGVPSETFQSLLSAKSPGKVFAELVRNQGPFERVDQPKNQEPEAAEQVR